MLIFMIILVILLAWGIYFIAADSLKIPYIQTTKAIANTGRRDKKITNTLEACLLEVAMKISNYIYVDPYKRNRLKNVLKAANIAMTPEIYTAYAYVKAGSVTLFALPCLFILPIIAPVFLIMAVAIFFKESGKAEEALKAKREKIDNELPRFVATVEQELRASRDVLSILENYKKNAGKDFAYELEVTCADMRSSSYEAALTRLEARINSPELSDVVRGLIGVLRGDDEGMYFRMLAHDFKQLELRKLKSLAEKIPPKIKVFSFIMLMCFIMTFLMVICIEVINSLGTMF